MEELLPTLLVHSLSCLIYGFKCYFPILYFISKCNKYAKKTAVESHKQPTALRSHFS